MRRNKNAGARPRATRTALTKRQPYQLTGPLSTGAKWMLGHMDDLHFPTPLGGAWKRCVLDRGYEGGAPMTT